MKNKELLKFAEELNELMPIVMRELGRNQARELCRGKITFPQFFILDYLDKEGESTMSGISKFMSVTKSAMSNAMDRLVESGYCQRVYDDNDRRIIRMKITSKARGIVKKLNQQRKLMFIKVFGKFSQKERSEYLKIIRRIHEIAISEKL